jgi:hypothetical protein
VVPLLGGRGDAGLTVEQNHELVWFRVKVSTEAFEKSVATSDRKNEGEKM